MSEQDTWIIQTKDLQIGTTLGFDLTDASGNVLLKAGVPINDRIKERLHKKNIHSVVVRGEAKTELAPVDSVILGAFPLEATQAIQASIDTTQKALLNFVVSLRENGTVDTDELNSSVEQFVTQANQNVAATLAVISLRAKQTDRAILEKISGIATKTSLLSVVMSVTKKDTVESSIDIGIAGLLHDCSLMLHPEWFSLSGDQRDEKFLDEYRRHPIESAELLNGVPGIPKNSITIVTQVHEQADGSGYPRGLKQSQVLPGAVILNVVDAYFTLTEPLLGKPLIPADAMAYLCSQVSQGKFCKNTLHLMLQCMSIYPVGSTVSLDDDSKAVVIQSNAGKPMQPIVRLLHSGNPRIDLRESKRFIASPYLVGDDQRIERIQKLQMQKVLWRTDV